ncbi:MAG: VWA domain-containing protein [Candidatus Omnitrophota bacterium]
MKFGAPYMAVWLWLLPLVIFFYVWANNARRKGLERFASANLISEIAKTCNPRRRKIKNTMLVLAVFFLLGALVRPKWGFRWQEVKRRGLDIIIALDTSKSMLAQDVLPDRLERSKLAIKDLVKKLQGDRIGLVAFSGTAFLQCPLTIDYNGFLLSLDDITVDTVPVGGTSLAKAIYTSVKGFEGGRKKHNILIIITDGEDLEGGVDRAVEKAKSAGVKIYCVGIGTAEGEIIPIITESGKKTFLKDAEGNIVKTQLGEDLLKKIAFDTGGAYVRSTGAEFGLDLIYDQELSKFERQEFKSKMEKQYNERFQWPLVFAFVLLFIEPLIGDKRKNSV